MVMHLRSLDESSLARRIYEEQKARKWPGLAKETSSLCNKLEVEDCNTTRLGKNEYRKLFIKACRIKHEAKMKDDGSKLVKCERILVDDYGMKTYFQNKNVFEARQMFRTRVGLQPFAANYKNSMRFKQTNWLCRCLKESESETHIKEGRCPIYMDIREKYASLEDDDSLLRYFGEVIARRDALDGSAGDRGGADTATDTLLAGDILASQSGGVLPS